MHFGAECDIICANESLFAENFRFNDCRNVEEGIKSLNAYWGLLDEKKLRKPVFRMVLTAVGDYAYARKEYGIIVCPISALKP